MNPSPSPKQNKPTRTILTIIIYFLLGSLTCLGLIALAITAILD